MLAVVALAVEVADVPEEVEEGEAITVPPLVPFAVPPLVVVPVGGAGGMLTTETVGGEIDALSPVPPVPACVADVVTGALEVLAELEALVEPAG